MFTLWDKSYTTHIKSKKTVVLCHIWKHCLNINILKSRHDALLVLTMPEKDSKEIVQGTKQVQRMKWSMPAAKDGIVGKCRHC